MFGGGVQKFEDDGEFCLSRFHVAADFGLKKIHHWENLQSPHCKKIPLDDGNRRQRRACMERGGVASSLPVPCRSGPLSHRRGERVWKKICKSLDLDLHRLPCGRDSVILPDGATRMWKTAPGRHGLSGAGPWHPMTQFPPPAVGKTAVRIRGLQHF